MAGKQEADAPKPEMNEKSKRIQGRDCPSSARAGIGGAERALPPPELVAAVLALLSGSPIVDRGLSGELAMAIKRTPLADAGQVSDLPPYLWDVLACMSDGMSSPQIAKN